MWQIIFDFYTLDVSKLNGNKGGVFTPTHAYLGNYDRNAVSNSASYAK